MAKRSTNFQCNQENIGDIEMFIDAKVIKGVGRSFSCTLQVKDNTGQTFIPLDLSPFAIRFRVLGSTTADGYVLIEHIITQFTDPDVDGQIYDPENGEFAFCINKDDTEILGIGSRPITIELLDTDTLEYIDTITQGGKNGEFNRIMVIQV